MIHSDPDPKPWALEGAILKFLCFIPIRINKQENQHPILHPFPHNNAKFFISAKFFFFVFDTGNLKLNIFSWNYLCWLTPICRVEAEHVVRVGDVITRLIHVHESPVLHHPVGSNKSLFHKKSENIIIIRKKSVLALCLCVCSLYKNVRIDKRVYCVMDDFLIGRSTWSWAGSGFKTITGCEKNYFGPTTLR